jgi:hypothetical protein
MKNLYHLVIPDDKKGAKDSHDREKNLELFRNAGDIDA